jgi:DNA polymerase kappa
MVVKKAGINSDALERAKQIIETASKHSEYYKCEEEAKMELMDKVAKYKERVEETKLDKKLWEKFEAKAARKIESIARELDFSRTWIHFDMDAFYAACEIRDEPSLAEVPLAIEDKNMIMTTNYKAREYGVRSGIPAFIGKRLCPKILFMKPDFPKYRAASKVFKDVLRNYDPDFEEVGLDEANLDVTDYLQKNKMDNDIGRLKLAQKIRDEIKDKTKMTASCGIAPNKMLAKICSDINKPDG